MTEDLPIRQTQPTTGNVPPPKSADLDGLLFNILAETFTTSVQPDSDATDQPSEPPSDNSANDLASVFRTVFRQESEVTAQDIDEEQKREARENYNDPAKVAVVSDPDYLIEAEDISVAKAHPDSAFAEALAHNEDVLNASVIGSENYEDIRQFIRENPNTLFAKEVMDRSDFAINSDDIEYALDNLDSAFAKIVARRVDITKINDESTGIRDAVREDPNSAFAKEILKREDYTINDADINYAIEELDSAFAKIVARRVDITKINDESTGIRDAVRDDPTSVFGREILKRSDYTVNVGDISYALSDPDSEFAKKIVTLNGFSTFLNDESSGVRDEIRTNPTTEFAKTIFKTDGLFVLTNKDISYAILNPDSEFVTNVLSSRINEVLPFLDVDLNEDGTDEDLRTAIRTDPNTALAKAIYQSNGFILSQSDIDYLIADPESAFATAAVNILDLANHLNEDDGNNALRNSIREDANSSLAKAVFNKHGLFTVLQSDVDYITSSTAHMDGTFAGILAAREDFKPYLSNDDVLNAIRTSPNSALAKTVAGRKDLDLSAGGADSALKDLAREKYTSSFATLLLKREDYIVEEADKVIARNDPYSTFANILFDDKEFAISSDDYSFARSNLQSKYTSVIVKKEGYNIDPSQDIGLAWDNPYSAFANALMANPNLDPNDFKSKFSSNTNNILIERIIGMENYTIDTSDHTLAQNDPYSKFARRIVQKDDYTVEAGDAEAARAHLYSPFAWIAAKASYIIQAADRELAARYPYSTFAIALRQNPNY